jgi:hypothetical protein
MARPLLPSASRARRLVPIVLAAALLADFVVVAASRASSSPAFSATLSWWQWDATADWSFAEILGYLKLTLAAAFLLSVWNRTRVGVYRAWAVIFLALVADDALLLHERIGKIVANLLHFPSVGGLRPVDLGEIAVWGLAGLVLGALLLLEHRRAARPARRASWMLLSATALLAVFSVLLDAVDSMLHGLGVAIAPVMNSLEAGGELVAMSLMLGAAVLIWSRTASRLPSGFGSRSAESEPVLAAAGNGRVTAE